jgi:hypothetical protein
MNAGYRLYDISQHESRHFMAMELLEGQTLKHLVADQPLAIARRRG